MAQRTLVNITVCQQVSKRFRLIVVEYANHRGIDILWIRAADLGRVEIGQVDGDGCAFDDEARPVLAHRMDDRDTRHVNQPRKLGADSLPFKIGFHLFVRGIGFQRDGQVIGIRCDGHAEIRPGGKCNGDRRAWWSRFHRRNVTRCHQIVGIGIAGPFTLMPGRVAECRRGAGIFGVRGAAIGTDPFKTLEPGDMKEPFRLRAQHVDTQLRRVGRAIVEIIA